MIFTYDEKSEFWLEPFSIIIHCMFPMECVYNEWFELQEKLKIEKSNLEVFFSSSNDEILVGSLAEGFCIPNLFVSSTERSTFSVENALLNATQWNSDKDAMQVISHSYKTVTNSEIPIFTVQHVEIDKRYVKLQLTEEWKKEKPKFKKESFLHQTFLLPEFSENPRVPTETQSVHGPVLNRILETSIFLEKGNMHFSYLDFDDAYVFSYPIAWPEHAMEWLTRYRENNWPSAELIQDIFESSCHIAPVGRWSRNGQYVDMREYMKNPEQSLNFVEPSLLPESSDNLEQMDGFEWRISFSIAENKLAASIPPIPRYIMVLLKMIKKFYFPEDMCTYHLKNLLYWELENMDKAFWSITNTFKCLLHLLDRLVGCVKKQKLPHYFIPESNLLSTMIPERSVQVAGIIENIRTNIVSHMLSMMRRIQALGLNLKEFICGLELDDFVMGIKAKTTNMEVFHQSILCYMIEVLKLTVENRRISYNRALKDESDIEVLQRLLLAIYSYQSVLSRIICYRWFTHKHYNDGSKERFLAFVFKELESIKKVNYMPNIESISLMYFESLVENGDLLGSILNVFTYLKERFQLIHQQKTLINDGTLPDLVGIVGDLKDIEEHVEKQLEKMGNPIVTVEQINELRLKQYKPIVTDPVVIQHLNDKNMLGPLFMIYSMNNPECLDKIRQTMLLRATSKCDLAVLKDTEQNYMF